MSKPITAQLLKSSRRAQHVAKLFGARFLWIESFVFDTASSLSKQYDGGHWRYFALSNGGFYMAPARGEPLSVSCSNGFEGQMSSDALGITSCLYAYSSLSFSPDTAFAENCADHYHLLRAFVRQHAEAKSILAAVD
jgi:hypothetical protein